MSRVVLFGAAGYLGQAVAASLGELNQPSRVETARSIRELADNLTREDTILNCAGYVGNDRRRLWEANVDHPEGLARAAGASGARLIHVSSSAVFDGIRSGELTEKTRPRPRSTYGASKLEGEHRVTHYLPEACLVRPSKLFGGNDPRRRLHSLVAHVEAGRPLPTPSRPQLWANFVWVRDASRVLAECVVDPPVGAVVHLASPLPWSDFVTLLEAALDRPVRPASRVLEVALSAAATTLERLPMSPPRRGARLLELWDRRVFRDTNSRLDAGSVLDGLRDVVHRRRQ
jgi:dTDP-4-dehydrorhamnose reductase